jgi:hypothetical protein
MEKDNVLPPPRVNDRVNWKTFGRIAGFAFFALTCACSLAPTFAQQPGQRTFASEQDAASALFAAMQSPDQQALLDILGPDGKDIVSSGDQVEDLNLRLRFVERSQQMHRFAAEQNGTVTLLVGTENWPLPIPLVNSLGSWYFDTAAGKAGIVFRRIRKNELSARDACGELVEAQKQYFARPPDGIPKQFAQRLVSDAGRHNGLYWEDAYVQFTNPINPLIVNAFGGGPDGQGRGPLPFNGYSFRMLTSQGPYAPGGARNYIVDGKMTGGFAFVAYPAEYRSSGVMTFIVNNSGVIFEKDLGPDTTKLAEALTSYDPDSTWRRAE